MSAVLDPHSSLSPGRDCPQPPIPVLQRVLAQALRQEQLLLLSPSPAPLLLPPLGKERQPQGAPRPPQQGACSPASGHPHRTTPIPQLGAPRGWQGSPGSGRALTCSPVAIPASTGCRQPPPALKCPQAGGMRQPYQLQLVGWADRAPGRGCQACHSWGAGREVEPPLGQGAGR